MRAMAERGRRVLAALAAWCLLLAGCGSIERQGGDVSCASVQTIPDYSGEPYVALFDNEPGFTEEDLTTNSYETYSELDSLGRCGAAAANVGVDLMPTEERGSIGSVKPSGWQSVKYDCVDGRYLYNRCHLIAGTRYLNIEGMLPFENMVADYVKETENHVLYRVTPYFEGDELVARGVQIEAMSVEETTPE